MPVPTDYSLGRPTHLLLVDDSAMNLTIMRACCDLFGATHDSAKDGVEALEAVERRLYDAVLMDVRMPRMDGVQAAQRIACMPAPTRHTPVIGVTGDVTEENRVRCLAAGMRAVVEKPIRIELLFAALTHALETAVLVG